VSSDAAGTVVGQTSSTVTEPGPQTQYSFTLGNVPLPTISGEVFSDINGNGKLDTGETGISGTKVYLDKNDDGKWETGEKYQIVTSTGKYDFDPLTAGTYYVREALPANYRRTEPSSGKYTCVLTNGVNGTDKNFGDDPRVNISGTVFGDNNSNGKQDSGDGGASGWTIYIDSNNDGKLDDGETSVKTSSTGSFAFNNLKAGTFHIRIQSVSGYKFTTSTVSTFTLAGGGVQTGVLFGIKKT
jgi:uncharacterized protein (DUF2141 family)